MALDQLNQKIDQIRNSATAAWKEHKDLEKFVNSNRNLSDAGRRAEIDESLTKTRARLRELEQMEMDEIAKAERRASEALNRKGGNSPSDIISFRDAQDRAERVEAPAEAERIMKRAILSDDPILATAIMRRAITQGWDSVYAMYADEHPDVGEHVKDLAQISRYEASMLSMTDRFVYEIAGA